MLVDRARPERLGELVRHLKSERPDVEVLLEAPQLAAVPEGSTVVLCLRAEDRTWLNLARPIVAARALRLFLWSDEASTVALVQGAIDFFDWISHRIECPEGPPAHVVQALRRAVLGRAPAIVWQGEGFERAFEEACPGRRVVSVSGALPYPEIVASMRPRPREWVAVTGIDGDDRYDRIRWAAAEAGRFGRTVLVGPSADHALPMVDARTVELSGAAARLREAGSTRPVRLAALLDLSEKRVLGAEEKLRSGTSEGDIEASILEDSGAARRRTGSPVSATWPRRLPGFSERVRAALDVADLGVATGWARGWRKAAPKTIAAALVQADLETRIGDLDLARSLLLEVRERLHETEPSVSWMDLWSAETAWHYAAGEMKEALAAAERGLALAQQEGLHDRAAGFRVAVVFGSYVNDDVRRSLLVLDDWTREHLAREPSLTEYIHWARARSYFLWSWEHQSGDAMDLLESAWGRMPPRRPDQTAVETDLARLWISHRRAPHARALMLRALEREERRGGPRQDILRTLGVALMDMGRYAEAADVLRASLALRSRGLVAGETRSDLTMCLLLLGRFDDAASEVALVRSSGLPTMIYRAIALETLMDVRRDHPLVLGPPEAASSVPLHRFGGLPVL